MTDYARIGFKPYKEECVQCELPYMKTDPRQRLCPECLQDSKDTKRLADKKLKERIEAGRIEARPMTRRVGRHMEDTYFGENAVE